MSLPTPTFQSETSRPVSILIYVFGIVVLGFLVYANAIFHPFVHDDVVFIRDNPTISQIDLKAIFSPPQNLPGQGGLINTYYRPLLELVYRVQYRFFGLNAWMYHLFNIGVHILNALLVFFVSGRMFSLGRTFSASVAVLFLVHPVQTEAVACIAGVSNLLFALLCLSSFGLYLKSCFSEQKSNQVAYLVLALFLFFIAFFAKEQAIILPVLILAYEGFLYFDKETSIKRSLRTRVIVLLSFTIVTALYFILRTFWVGGGALGSLFANLGELQLRLLAVPRSLVIYLQTIFFPYDLHYYRSLDILKPNAWAFGVLLGIILVISFVIRMASKRIRPILIFAWIWFVVSLLPVLNIIPLITEYSWILVFEHFLYVPIIGVLIFVCAWCDDFFYRRQEEGLSVSYKVWFTIIVLLLSVITFRQNSFWRNEIALFERTLKYEDLARIRILLAKAYYFDKQYEKSILQNENALKIMKAYYGKVQDSNVKDFYKIFMKDIHFDTAHGYEALGLLPQAVSQYESALVLDPKDAVLYNNLGTVLIKQGQVEDAQAQFEKTLSLNPSDIMAQQNLAVCFLKQEKWEQAKEILKTLIHKNPNNSFAQKYLKQLQMNSIR